MWEVGAMAAVRLVLTFKHTSFKLSLRFLLSPLFILLYAIFAVNGSHAYSWIQAPLVFKSFFRQVVAIEPEALYKHG